ncbi:MAG TPA: dihydrolipoamide acetyltransferase family protein [bacterium]|nr:dihydrolipoamide acetyltransferase family protein [bacterium]HOL34733.1 dihydrolipoamide acetyltransferase family protein [bacterium]
MAVPIKIPDVGTTVEDITIVKWRKQKGDIIKRGEVIAEIETDKAVVELESIAEGKILEILFKEGDVVKQGTVIAYVGEETEAVPEISESGISISPALINLAKRLGVDIKAIKPSAADGVITRQDILDAARKITKEQKSLENIIEMTVHQRALINTLNISSGIPVFHITSCIDMGMITEFRNRIEDIYYDTFFVYACARVIRNFPIMFSYLVDNKIVRRKEISISVAISKGEKLYTPVIHSADKKSLEEINRTIAELVKKVNEEKLLPEETKGACFLISNLGMYPVESFDAMIPPQHSGALAIGRVRKTAVVENDHIVIKSICKVTGSFDHRLANGTIAAEFLKQVKEILESGRFREDR